MFVSRAVMDALPLFDAHSHKCASQHLLTFKEVNQVGHTGNNMTALPLRWFFDLNRSQLRCAF